MKADEDSLYRLGVFQHDALGPRTKREVLYRPLDDEPREEIKR
jgi:hypothetical protein